MGRPPSRGGICFGRSPSVVRIALCCGKDETFIMNESATHAAIEAIARNSYGRLIAYIAARSGDVVGAEDALGDAIAVALDRLQRDGVPQKAEPSLPDAARNGLVHAAVRHAV